MSEQPNDAKPITLSESRLLALWSEFMKSIARRFNETIVSLWFSEAIPLGLVQNNLFLMIEVDFKRNTVENRYRQDIEDFFSRELKEPVKLLLYSLPQAEKMPYFKNNREYLLQRTYDMFWALFPTLFLMEDAVRLARPDGKPEDLYFPEIPNGKPPTYGPQPNPGDVDNPPEWQMLSAATEHATPSDMPPLPMLHTMEPISLSEIEEQMSRIERANQAYAEQIKEESHSAIAPAEQAPSETPAVISELPEIPAGDPFDFDHFIVGNSNRLAHAACIAVAREPAKEYNPLFIWGPSGLGKTHLLRAIILKVQKEHPQLKIKYVKGEEFTNQMVESITYNRTEQFRESYRKVDILLIDDIQFIAGRESTQEEFFHTFNALYENQKQIILTSDRPPKEILRLEERLRTRFEWGMIADIAPPDLDLRIAILKKKAQLSSLNIPNEILTYIAQNLSNNVRQLEGAIKKIYANVVLLGNPLNMETTVSCIADLMTGAEPVSMTVDKILNRVAEKYEVTVESIKGTRRTKNIMQARHVAIYLIRTMTDMSFPQLGRMFDKDHATVMSSYNKIVNEIKKEDPFALEIREMERQIKE